MDSKSFIVFIMLIITIGKVESKDVHGVDQWFLIFGNNFLTILFIVNKNNDYYFLGLLFFEQQEHFLMVVYKG